MGDERPRPDDAAPAFRVAGGVPIRAFLRPEPGDHGHGRRDRRPKLQSPGRCPTLLAKSCRDQPGQRGFSPEHHVAGRDERRLAHGETALRNLSGAGPGQHRYPENLGGILASPGRPSAGEERICENRSLATEEYRGVESLVGAGDAVTMILSELPLLATILIPKNLANWEQSWPRRAKTPAIM